MVQTIKESIDAITLLAPEAGFMAPTLKEKAVICDDGANGGLWENEPTPNSVITNILYGLNQIIRQEADITSIANTRAWLTAHLRPSDTPVLPKLNVYSLTGKKLALELWINATEEENPVNNTPDNSKVSAPRLVDKASPITKDVDYTTLVPDSISCTRVFSAWDAISAPFCKVFQFSSGKDNRITTNNDMLARLCPFLPVNARDSVKTEIKTDKTYRAVIMEATPDAVFMQNFNQNTLSGTLIVVDIKSRELLSQCTNYNFYKDLYQIIISSICVRSENDLMEIDTMPVLRYRDCAVVITNYNALYQHIMACAPEAREFMIGSPTYISASDLVPFGAIRCHSVPFGAIRCHSVPFGTGTF